MLVTILNELEITVEPNEFWDPIKEKFIYLSKPQTIRLKHSLMSVAKWESKHKKSFFTEQSRLDNDFKDYIRCMTINGNFDDVVYDCITDAQKKEILSYIDDPMTACSFHDYDESSTRHGRMTKKITAEDIYYTMFEIGIPIDCEKWHLNRLIALIRYFEVKSGGGKKMSRDKTAGIYAALNAKRKAKYHTKG